MEHGVFASLIEADQVGKVTLGIERAVSLSFKEDTGRLSILVVGRVFRISKAEMKHRADICVKIFRILRGDLKWGVERAIDYLPRFLRSELDGVDWKPDARLALWTAPA